VVKSSHHSLQALCPAGPIPYHRHDREPLCLVEALPRRGRLRHRALGRRFLDRALERLERVRPLRSGVALREKNRAGRSEEEVKTFLLDRYGDFVLYRPRFIRSTAMLWLAPVLLLLVGGFALRRIVRRRATLPVDVDENGGPPSAA